MKQTFLTTKFILPTLIIATIYIISLTYFMNGSLIQETVLGAFPLSYKINLLLALLEGMWTTMTATALSVFILTGLLTGANLTLLGQRIASLRRVNGMHFIVGGNSLLAIGGSGCASCGLPILSLLGVSGSFAFLPLRGAELSYIAVLLLSISLYFMVKSYNTLQICTVNTENKVKLQLLRTIK